MDEVKGSWLIGGYLCERILSEKDETQSLIRIVDTINIYAEPNAIIFDGETRTVPEDKVGVFRVYYSASLVQAPSDQSSHIEISHINSLGERVSVIDDILTVPAPSRRISIIAALDIGLKREGESWIEAKLDGNVVLMTSLRARFVDPEPELEIELPDATSSDLDNA